MPPRLEHPTPGAWYEIGAEEWSLALCSFATRDSDKGFFVTGQTPERIRFGADIRRIVSRCDRSGHLEAFLDGLRWEQIPRECRKKICCGHCARALAEDLECFRATLQHRGFRVE